MSNPDLDQIDTLDDDADDFGLETPPENGDVEWDNDLHQEDINDILGFDLSAEEGEDRSGLRALINSAFVTHRRMPLLDIVFDRAARQMTTSLRHLTNDNVDVTLDDSSALRFGEFIQSVSMPAIVGVMKAEQLNGFCLIAVDATLVFSIIDVLLGGRRGGMALNMEERRFTQIELGLIENVMTLLAQDLSNAFKPVGEVTFQLDRLETTPRFATIAQDASVCSLAKYHVNMEERGGRAAVLFPHATLEPIQKTLMREFLTGFGVDETSWHDHLRTELDAARVDLKAVVAEKSISVKNLSDLKPGDTISFAGYVGETAELRAGDRLLAHGRVGRSGGVIAVRLSDVDIEQSQTQTAQSDSVIDQDQGAAA